MTPQSSARIVFALGLCLTLSRVTAAQSELTPEQMKEFLLKAKVVASKHTKKGITDPWRLTLSNGSVTHEAVFQAIDIHKTSFQFADGSTEINFVDSYKYNIGAFVLAGMLGLDDLIPVHVERKWNGQIGSLSWVVPVTMDEEERLKRKVSSPDPDSWNKQMYKIRVFDELVYDTDANLTNVLIGDNWKLWRVDFSRAFRLNKDVKDTKNLAHCDSQLFEKLKTLDEKELLQKTKDLLTKEEVRGVMARRDKIVAYIQKVIAAEGARAILY